MRRIIGVLAAVGLLAVVPASPIMSADLAQPTVKGYNSGNFSERYTSMPVGQTYPYPKRNLYCLDLGSAPKVGDLLFVTGEVEVTNDLRYKVMFQTQLLLADSCTADVGTEVGEANGGNLLYDVHHGTASRSGLLVVTAASSRRFVVLQAYAKALLGTPWTPSDTLRVEQDYGRLTVMRWQP
jgi:hypothetical protein